MKRFLLCFLLIAFAVGAKAQQWLGNYPYVAREVNNDHLGFFAELGVNSSGSFIDRQGYSATAKGALSLVPKVGVFYQKGFGERFSIRGSIAFGRASFAYKYAPAYDSMSPEQNAYATKKAKYERISHPSAFVQPQIDFGYLFGPIKKMYMIELRAGVGMPMYLGKSGDSAKVASGYIRYKGNNVGNLDYFSSETGHYGKPGNWGFLVADVYVGIRWKNTDSPFLNRSGLGIQATLPVSVTNAGYSQIEYKEQHQYYYIGVDKVDLALFSFGVRYTYNFL